MLKRKDILDPLAYLISLYKLRYFLNVNDINSVIEATKNYYGLGHYERISMTQKDEEIIKLANLVINNNPNIILEIGTKKGGTLFTWSRITQAKIIISIDLWRGDHGGGYSPKKKKFYKHFINGNNNRKMILFQENSRDEKVINNIDKLLAGNKIDFLFIDGDHSYNGVKSDFNNYEPFVANNGLIAFHDIVSNPHDPSIEVPRFWEKIKNKYLFTEIIEDTNQTSMGIGVLHKGGII